MIIVTGATGLVGSHLLCELVKSHEYIRACYQTKSKIKQVQKVFEYYFPTSHAEMWSKITWTKLDLLDLTNLNDVLEENAKVYHCAALVSFHPRDFKKLMKINREGTGNLVNVCLQKNIEKLCYVSSTAAVGGGAEGEVNEKNSWKKSEKTSAYSISKYSAEKEVWRAIEEGLNAVIVNPSVVLGAGNWNDSSLTILKQVNKGLSFYPTGSNATVDARDVATCMVQLMESDITEERYLVIGSNQSFQDLFSRIAEKMGKTPPKHKVGRTFLIWACYVTSFCAALVGRRSPITKDTVNSATGNTKYSNKKIIKAINHKFYTLDQTIENAIKGKIT